MRGRFEQRQHRRAAERCRAEITQDPSYDIEVCGFAGVRRGCEGELLAVVGLPAGVEQADRLQRLVGRPGEDGSVEIAQGECAGPVGAERDDRSGVAALDVAGADDIGQDHDSGAATACSASSVATSASPSR